MRVPLPTATVLETALERHRAPSHVQTPRRPDGATESSAARRERAGRRCPEPSCRESATIDDRFVLSSTDGPVVMLKTRCARGHWFTVPERSFDLYREASPITLVRDAAK
jgi:hypothetical protein